MSLRMQRLRQPAVLYIDLEDARLKMKGKAAKSLRDSWSENQWW